MGLAAMAIAGALVTGRVPGTTELATGPRLGSRTTRVTIEAGIARAEIEDVLVNDAPRELEARYVLRVPPGAAVTRAALDVDGTLVEGNVVEAGRARGIYRSIVDETRRDPLLVERLDDGSVSIRVFPLPGHGSRRIVLAYDEPSPVVGDASVATATLGQEAIVVRASLRTEAPPARAIAIDVSRGQTEEAIAAEIAVARRLLDAAKEGNQFVVLACDSACESMPSSGLLTVSALTVAATKAWMRDLRPRGARDLAGGIAEAASRVPGGGQVIWLGGGTPTAGDLDRFGVGVRVQGAVGASRELRLVDVGGDGGDLASAATALHATYDRIELDADRATSAERVAARLGSYALQAPRLETPAGVQRVSGAAMPDRIAAGDPITLLGAGVPGREMPTAIVVRATIAGRPISRTLPIETIGTTDRADLLLAGARIEVLERAGDPISLARAGRIAQQHRVLARHGSWLALESESMMRAFDIARDGRSGAPAGAHVPRPVMLRVALSIVAQGRLPAENVQHTIRSNTARFRFCYEAGLRAHPGLAGRVTLKFVIRPTGEVSSAEDAGSDLPDPETIACFVRTARTLAFPGSERATITVVYPFVLTPLDEASDGSDAGRATPGPRPLLQLRVPSNGLPDPHEMWLLRYRVADAPGDPASNEELASALMKLGRPGDALAALEAFAHAAPAEPRAYELLLTHPAQTSPMRSAEAASALADLFPRCAAAQVRAADAWTAARDPRRAAAHRRAALSLPRSLGTSCTRPR